MSADNDPFSADNDDLLVDKSLLPIRNGSPSASQHPSRIHRFFG